MTMKGGVGKRKYDHDEICRLYKGGCSIPKICEIIGCTQGAVVPALRRAGVQMRSISDAQHLARGGRLHKWAQGYVGICPEKNKRMPYHRYIMEQVLGRTLSRDEVVHHIDGDRTNNDLSNLVVMSRSEHSKLHHQQGDIRK